MRFSHSVVRAVAVTISIVTLCGMTDAQVAVSVITQTGQQIPGADPGVVFARQVLTNGSRANAFYDVAIDATGAVTVASSTPLDATSSLNRVHRSTVSGLAPVWVNGGIDQARNAAALWAAHHTLLFTDGAAACGITENGLPGYAIADPALIVPMLRGELAAPPSTTWFLTELSNNCPVVTANRTGQGVFVDSVSNGTNLLRSLGYFAPETGPMVLFKQLDTLVAAPGAGTVNSIFIPAIGSNGTILAGCKVGVPGRPVLLAGPWNNLRAILLDGQPVQGLPATARPRDFNTGSDLTSFNRAPIGAVGPDGTLASFVSFSGITDAITLLAGTPAGIQVALRDLSSVPGLSAGTVVRFSSGIPDRLMVARGGLVAVNPALGTTSQTSSDRAVIAGTVSGFTTIVKTGDSFPGVPGVTVVSPTLVGINAAGDVLVDQFLGGSSVTNANNAAIVAYARNLGPIVVLRKGDTITLAPGDTRTVQSYSFGGTDATFRNAQINDSRQIVADIIFTDASEAVVRFSLPLPQTACRADFDLSGNVEVADIFAFLSAWFAGELRADFHGSGALGVPDIFSFLSAWFAGC